MRKIRARVFNKISWRFHRGLRVFGYMLLQFSSYLIFCCEHQVGSSDVEVRPVL